MKAVLTKSISIFSFGRTLILHPGASLIVDVKEEVAFEINHPDVVFDIARAEYSLAT